MNENTEKAIEVVKALFGTTFLHNPAKDKEEADARLFLAHTLVSSLLLGNTGQGELLESRRGELSDIEEQLSALRHEKAVPKAKS